jgi:hypothetical protein
MADKNLTVGIDIKANSAEAKAAAAAMTSVANAAKQATVTANGASQASKELGKSGNTAAMGILAASNAFQDVQYGMQGVINNIPGIVSGMGLGMGVAGVAQAAAVGIQILTKNFDLFGTEAAKAAEEAEVGSPSKIPAGTRQRTAEHNHGLR